MDSTLQLHSVNVGTAQPVRIGERRILTAIGKSATPGPVAVGPLGLAGDEQADLSVHGGLAKAVYAYPAVHYAFWQAQRRERGISPLDETLPPGFLGENLTVSGLLEQEVFVGDRLHFPDCVLRVTAPREPCYKFAAVMGFAQAGRAMALAGCCGYYLAVEQPGSLAAGQTATLVPGQRGLSIAQAFAGKWAKHRH
ncbi:MOSC domain-containing protein [Acidovorax soli]|uniref:MOSC domain-containing protein YiiM n=1 Tax=Acidovorax soli TaxID=592050 RepID=A0A1H3XT23_9BURK|nr:MOSC domain-containing protein [Acidovorax soli]SEA02595.1 MOSC domain-containing protein YiiM [Acidovorax soli]